MKVEMMEPKTQIGIVQPPDMERFRVLIAAAFEPSVTETVKRGIPFRKSDPPGWLSRVRDRFGIQLSAPAYGIIRGDENFFYRGFTVLMYRSPIGFPYPYDTIKIYQPLQDDMFEVPELLDMILNSMADDIVGAIRRKLNEHEAELIAPKRRRRQRRAGTKEGG